MRKLNHETSSLEIKGMSSYVKTKFKKGVKTFHHDPDSLNFCSPSTKPSIKQQKSKSVFAFSTFSLPLKSPDNRTECSNASSSLKRKKFVLQQKFHDIISDEFQNNRVRIYHQKPTSTLNMKNTNNIVMHLHRRPARDTKSMTAKVLFRSNLAKYFDGKFSDQIEGGPTFSLAPEKKNEILEPIRNFNEERIKSYLMSFSKKYPSTISHLSTKPNCIQQFKVISKINFKEKESELFQDQLEANNFSRSHKKAFSQYSGKTILVTTQERTKFAKMVNFDPLSLHSKRSLFELFGGESHEEIEALDEEGEVFFEELDEEHSQALIQKPQHKQKVHAYSLLLGRFEKERKNREISYLNSAYSKNYRKNLLKQRMLACLIKLARMKLDIKDLPKISYKPFQREGSFMFLEAVRLGDQMKVEEVLNKNKLLIYDFDQFHQTALHIACKKCNFPLLRALIEHGAELNAIDLGQKTALFVALERNFVNGVRFLLFFGANPWSSKECLYEQAVKSKLARLYLKRAREISIVLKFVNKNEEKKKLWMTQRRFFAKIWTPH